MTINGILYVLVTGVRWMDMSARYGSYKTCWRMLKRWSEEGVWKRILEALISKGYLMGRLSLERVAVDSTTVEARKGEIVGYDGYRHRKGLMVQAVVSGESLPLSIVVCSGNEHDSKGFIDVMESIRVKHSVGRPRSRPIMVQQTRHTTQKR